MQVLVVEDNPGDQQLIRRAFDRLSSAIDLYFADDGVKALEFLHREGSFTAMPRPHFVLLDLKLPRKGGLDVLREMKRDPQLRGIPVIVLTSSNAGSDISAAYDSQASAYYAKPVTDFHPVASSILQFMQSVELPGQEAATPVQPETTRRAETDPRHHDLAAIVEWAADAILSMDVDGSIRSWNAAAERLYGYTAAEAIGRNVRLLVPAERVGQLHDILQAVHKGDANQRLETVRVDSDGHSRVISWTISPVRDRFGSMVGASAIARDVTERKAAEDRFRLAVESAPSGMVMSDAGGKILLVNAEAERMFGYARGELIGRSVELLVPGRYSDGHPRHRAEFLRRPEARSMGGGRELFAVRKDGSEFPVEIGLNPIDTPDGLVVLSAIVDITERKHAEERFRLAVDSSPNGMVMTDERGNIMLVNTETERMFGYSRTELVGRSIELLVPARFRGQHPVHRAAFFEAPAARSMGAGRDLYAARKDGSEFPVEIGLNPIHTPNGMFVLSAIVDITERKQAEDDLARRTRELARSNAELEQFAYVASHDLQEPLRMVASFTSLLAAEYADTLDETAREYIRFAVDGAVRMEQLIRDLLTYARLSTRAEEPTQVDLNQVLDVCCRHLQVAIDEANADIEVGELPTLAVDESQFVELFQNLLSNALKFRSERAPRIEVAARRERAGWLISVSDNGIGIDERHLEEVFQVFRRLHHRDDYAGTGIGLAICKRVVERHGGRIELRSELGRGTSVIIRVPDDAGLRQERPAPCA